MVTSISLGTRTSGENKREEARKLRAFSKRSVRSKLVLLIQNYRFVRRPRSWLPHSCPASCPVFLVYPDLFCRRQNVVHDKFDDCFAKDGEFMFILSPFVCCCSGCLYLPSACFLFQTKGATWFCDFPLCATAVSDLEMHTSEEAGRVRPLADPTFLM